MHKTLITTVAVSCIAFTGCKVKSDMGQVTYTGEQAIIYKTNGDYSKNVAVTLNDSHSSIIAYPAPADVYRNGKLAYPEALGNGFLLDNRGINANTAFLNLTYEEYAKLSAAPPLADMMAQIKDKEPITEIYNLGSRSTYKNEVADINRIISKGDLSRFKKLK